MPKFKFRCVNTQGEPYWIEQEGLSYEDAKERAIAAGHSVLPVHPPQTVTESPSRVDKLASAIMPRSGREIGPPRDTNQILESIDDKLTEVLRFTKLARIVLIIWIALWFIGMCIWFAVAVGLLGSGFAMFGRHP